MDGIEATRRLPRQRILVLTTFGLDEYIVEALRAGASGFLTKDVPRQELVAAVKAVANGDAVLSPAGHAPAARPRRAPAPHADADRRRRRAHRPRARGPAADRRRPLQRGDRRRARGRRADRQAPRLQPARQARPQRPRAGRDLRLRERAGRAPRLTAGARPASVYGVVVLSVNVSVFEYAPVRSASVALMACVNVTVTDVVGDRRRSRSLRERQTASGDGSENAPFDQLRRGSDDRQRRVTRRRDDGRRRRRRVVLRHARRERAERRRRRAERERQRRRHGAADVTRDRASRSGRPPSGSAGRPGGSGAARRTSSPARSGTCSGS